jgi:pantoate--beta-alanine ligase
MKLIQTPTEMQRTSESLRLAGKRIAVVMTMGALHDGHLSLVRLAKTRADVVILTIFVNPMQFGKNEDLSRYPRPFENDSRLAESAGVDVLFHPDADSLYGDNFLSAVEVSGVTDGFEGAIRPGHFRGVATVVFKLLNLTKPHVAVFGQKDAQQLTVIQKMVSDLNCDVEILPAPIAREQDGLAMSSRNIYLSADERRAATSLSQSLTAFSEALHRGERNLTELKNHVTSRIQQQPLAVIDYAAIVSARDFSEADALRAGETYFFILAVRFGSTRLLDNCKFTV